MNMRRDREGLVEPLLLFIVPLLLLPPLLMFVVVLLLLLSQKLSGIFPVNPESNKFNMFSLVKYPKNSGIVP